MSTFRSGSFTLTGRVILPDQILDYAAIEVEDGHIAAISTKAKRTAGPIHSAGMGYISPGFIDIHVHGGAGADYMDGTFEAVQTANRAHLHHGTTTLFPTTTTGTPAEIQRMFTACSQVRATWKVSDGAQIAGVHLYGPYFAADKVGCHSKDGRRNPSAREYSKYFSQYLVTIATCAAELPGAIDFYKAAQKQDCLITCGHSNASWPEMEAAFKAGLRHVDHFWCAMSNVSSVRQRLGTPMRGSMEQFVLANPEMSTEVIADGEHLAPELLEFAYKQKGANRLCLVTDANRALDMPPGHYIFGPEKTGSKFQSNGKVGFVKGQGLASSVVALDTMVRNMKKATSASLPEVIRMASLTPAERAGIARQTGSIEIGKRADLLILNQNLQVRRVFARGQEAR